MNAAIVQPEKPKTGLCAWHVPITEEIAKIIEAGDLGMLGSCLQQIDYLLGRHVIAATGDGRKYTVQQFRYEIVPPEKPCPEYDYFHDDDRFPRNLFLFRQSVLVLLRDCSDARIGESCEGTCFGLLHSTVLTTLPGGGRAEFHMGKVKDTGGDIHIYWQRTA